MNPSTPTDALLPSDGGQEPIFPDPPAITFCSWNQCLAGHIWPVTLAVAPCPACKTGIIAVKKENCPTCNEPSVHISIRADHLPRGGGVSERCKGKPGVGDTLDIVLDRSQQLKFVEEGTKSFEERTALERAKVEAAASGPAKIFESPRETSSGGVG